MEVIKPINIYFHDSGRSMRDFEYDIFKIIELQISLLKLVDGKTEQKQKLKVGKNYKVIQLSLFICMLEVTQ